MSRLPLLPDFPRPLLFAHRGVSSVAPENTRAAFALARQLGVPGVELDVHRCASGELVVTHDYSTKRVTGTELEIESTPWERLRDLDAGSWKGPEYKGERLPLLADLLEEFGADLYWDIEIKSRVHADAELEEALARLLDSPRLAGRLAVSSFNPFVLGRFKALSPKIPTAIIWCRSKEQPWYLRHGEGRWIAGTDFLKPDKALVKTLPLPGGRERAAWTVDEPAEARRLLSLGCSGIISNRPHELGIPLGR
ncbi:MAG TPA: glycerophosphodiester phosphodiesterase family protein [Spirochaetia bacterium]|nr:glycerophosphodiester phosphodiesterase family protein [Spirochaetales bacterium]HRY80012.1 glycerophosphodiester phosphodiesterase family protein [Spirochaetia bacterium]HRZ90897.1 glycerophosphodiester phosphodiesterase family protein [Spirochaetia bacterium]